MESYHTIPEMLLGQAARHKVKHALNDRVEGEWRSISMADLVQRVCCLAAALEKRLSATASCVGILAAPSANWLMVDMATMLAGHVAVPFFVDFSEAHLRHKIEDTGMKVIFVFGELLWARFRPLADRFDLIVTDQMVMDIPGVFHLDELLFHGAERIAAEPGLDTRLLRRIKPDDLAVIIYTSGSTGTPKGVEITHRNLVSQLHDIEPLFPIRPGKDRALSLLPVAHCFERIVIYLYLARGMSVYFVDDRDHLGVLLQEVRPTMMTVVPRLLEKTYERIAEKSKLVFGPLGGLARWTWRHASRTEVDGGGTALADRLADRLVGWQIRKSLGGRLRTMVVGGAHMPDDLNRFFMRMGVPLFEGYGMTEAAPVICVNYAGHQKPGTVGRPLPSVQVKLSGEGEVLARGPNIMRGYHNRPDETAEAIDADGWLHTGDLGQLDADGYLRIVARKKELFKTSTGEMVRPQPIERALCRSEWIEMACVVAEGRRFASCLLFLNHEALARLKQRCAETHVPASEFINSTAVHTEIQALIRQINADLDHWEQLRAYALLLEAPTVENGQLTPTLKLRRHEVEEHYKDMIEKLYRDTRNMEESNEFAIGHC